MLQHICPDIPTGEVRLLDQRLLPRQEVFVLCRNAQDMTRAIQTMVVRGAPAIGVSAAWGCWAEAARLAEAGNLSTASSAPETWQQQLDATLDDLEDARPTAVNLAWAVRRMRAVWKGSGVQTAAGLKALWQKEAQRIHDDDIAANRAIGAFGADLLSDGCTVLTHCNAGSLATGGFGTALGVIYAAMESGKRISVLADETRPLFQGARLTAYELHKNNVSVKVVCDNACALLMSQGSISAVIVGADRIAANGDVVNKIGTYGVAIMARHFNIPFYVAAPLSTFDPKTKCGTCIMIEQRSADEVAYPGFDMSEQPQRVVPEGVDTVNYAFDVTPSALVSAIITERGILRAPYDVAILQAFS